MEFARSSRHAVLLGPRVLPLSALLATARRERAVPERSDRVDEPTASTDGRPAAPDAAAELTRLTLHAEEQARRVSDLQATIGQLQSALRSRVVIERAIGMLAERFDLSIADAFELLRSAARDSRREVRELAKELTEARGWTPDEIVNARRRFEPS